MVVLGSQESFPAEEFPSVRSTLRAFTTQEVGGRLGITRAGKIEISATVSSPPSI